MPERALLRLKRAGIPLYKVQKPEKTRLLFEVKKKDLEKVFAIYPNVCYNNSTYRAYRVEELGSVGWGKTVDFLKNRAGVVLGIFAFCALTLATDSLVLGVDIVGSTVYTREVLQALDHHGVKKYALYPEGREKEVTAELLQIKGVEFCSVRRRSRRVIVEVRTTPFQTETLVHAPLQAERAGRLVELTVLRGTPLKKAGEEVEAGDALVADWFETGEGEKTTVAPIARARLACTYERAYECETEEEAFANAYLELDLLDGDEITEKSVTQTEKGFHVKINYLIVRKINL